MDWYVGMKVVCVMDDDYLPYNKQLLIGSIYVIRWIGFFPFSNGEKGGIGIKLYNVFRNPVVECVYKEFYDAPYGKDRFRPLINEIKYENLKEYNTENNLIDELV